MNLPGNLVISGWLGPLLELTEKLRDVTNLGHCLVHVVDAAKVLIPCEGASLRLFDEAREQFFAIARAGKNVHKPLTITLSANMGLLGWVGRHAVSSMVNDTREDERFEVLQVHQRRDIAHRRACEAKPI